MCGFFVFVFVFLITDSISLLATGLFWFYISFDTVLVVCYFVKICSLRSKLPNLLVYSCSQYCYNPFYFCKAVVTSPFVLDSWVFSFSWSACLKGLPTLLIFSKNQLLVLLIFCTVFLVSILLISFHYVLSRCLLFFCCFKVKKLHYWLRSFFFL